MEFKITIILSHIENQSVEDMQLNAQNYIKEFIEDGELHIERIEDITQAKKLASAWEEEGVFPTIAYIENELEYNNRVNKLIGEEWNRLNKLNKIK